MLSRTLEHNRTTLDPAALLQCRRQFDFDLFGSSLASLAPSYPVSLAYRPRRLHECPPAPNLSVVVPPWQRILDLVSEAAQGKVKASCLLVLPFWPAQPWWPLVTRLAGHKLWIFKGHPWISPGGKRLSYKAIAFWVNPPP